MNNLNNISLLNLIPSSIKDNPTVISAALTLDKEIKKINSDIEKLNIYPNIDKLDETLINELAWQFHVDFYDINLPLEVKRDLVKNSIPWHRIKGTPASMEQMLSTVFDNIHVEEWFDYDGLPYHFRVIVNALLDNEIDTSTIPSIIKCVKNVRSKLEKILFFLKGKTSVTEKYNLNSTTHRILSTFGRKNGIILDGTWDLDGSYLLDNGYRQIHVGSTNRFHIPRKIIITDDAWNLDGTYLLDGNKKLNGAVIVQRLNEEIFENIRLHIKDSIKESIKNNARNVIRLRSNFWFETELYLDGTWNLDGERILNGNEKYVKKPLSIINKNNIGIKSKEVVTPKLTIEKNWWTLDGAHTLGEGITLNAARYEEAI